jgi:hypothetical protein
MKWLQKHKESKGCRVQVAGFKLQGTGLAIPIKNDFAHIKKQNNHAKKLPEKGVY